MVRLLSSDVAESLLQSRLSVLFPCHSVAVAIEERTGVEVIEGILLDVEAALLVVRADPDLTSDARKRLESGLEQAIRRLIAQGLRSPTAASLF